MRGRRTWTGLGFAAVVAAALAARGIAEAEDAPAAPPGMPQFEKKVDQPLLKTLVGTWNVAHEHGPWPETPGKTTFALGVGDTAVLQSYEVSMGPMGTWYGHGIWKASDDGKTLNVWWIDVASKTPQHFSGPLTERGFDVKSERGTRLTLEPADKGFTFRLLTPDGSVVFTDAFSK
jgi:hypothetical protein